MVKFIRDELIDTVNQDNTWYIYRLMPMFTHNSKWYTRCSYKGSSIGLGFESSIVDFLEMKNWFLQ